MVVGAGLSDFVLPPAPERPSVCFNSLSLTVPGAAEPVMVHTTGTELNSDTRTCDIGGKWLLSSVEACRGSSIVGG